jgi:hypothetical protein
MIGETFHRSLLPISSVSLLGSCETRFMEAMEGRQKVTKQMKIGKVMHKKLEEGLPKVSPEQIAQQIKEGRKFGVREFSLTDKKLKLIGRIDQLDMLGRMENGKNQGIIIDDKYPKSEYKGIPLYYKLQLSAYAAAVDNSEVLGPICNIVGVSLVCREAGTHNILNTFTVEGSNLEICKGNVGIATGRAWELYDKKKDPEHRRFDVGRGDWIGCYCNKFST